MKITIKKNLIIFHSVREFEELHHSLFKEYGQSTMMISWKMKRELGFTIRHHKGLVPHDAVEWKQMKEEGWTHRYHYEEQVHLDFYNESAMSWFVLKYLNNTD
jgi:hypothetical protein